MANSTALHALLSSGGATIHATPMTSPVTQNRQMMIGYILLLSQTIVEGCECEQCDDRRHNIHEMTSWLFA